MLPFGDYVGYFVLGLVFGCALSIGWHMVSVVFRSIKE